VTVAHNVGQVIIIHMTEVTRILNQIEKGDPAASEELLPLVYEELRVYCPAASGQ
jgi:hypothetical protein